MPKYELPKFSTEELLAAFGSQLSPAGVIKAGTQGLKQGADLASTITETKGKKLKQQQEIAEIERKLAAQELLAKTVEGKPEMERKKLSLQPLAPKRAIGPETATGQVPMEPESPEYKKGVEEVQLETEKRKLLSTAIKAGLPPEKVLDQLSPDTSAKVGQMQVERVRIPGMGPTLVNIDKVNRKVYDMQGKDITEVAAKAIPYFAPATFVGTGGVEMLPRVEGSYRPTKKLKKGEKITSIDQLMPTEFQSLQSTKEDFNTDPAVKVALAKQADYDMADAVVGIGNWVGDAAVLSVAAKGLGRDVGNLSTEEQRRYRMSPAIFDMIKTQSHLWEKGTIRPEDRDAFKEAIRVMKEKNNDILNSKIDKWGRVAQKRVRNLDPQWAKDYLYEPTSTEQPQTEQPVDSIAQILGLKKKVK